MNKIDWMIATHELIADYKLPYPYLDDDYLNLDDLFEEGHAPEEAIEVLKDCGEI